MLYIVTMYVAMLLRDAHRMCMAHARAHNIIHRSIGIRCGISASAQLAGGNWAQRVHTGIADCTYTYIQQCMCTYIICILIALRASWHVRTYHSVAYIHTVYILHIYSCMHARLASSWSLRVINSFLYACVCMIYYILEICV